MEKKKICIILSIILIIYFTGFIFRLDSVNLYGIKPEKKSFYMMDDEGIPYMYELDSYYHYRLTKNFLDHGYLGDRIINGVEWDSYSYYPPGVPMDYPPLLIYITALLYKLINIFTRVPLLTVGFWLPAFMGPLAGVVTYLFVRRFSNEVGGLVSGLITVLTPLYLIRTVPGWFDTDMFNVLFPILVVWFFMEAIHTENFKKKVIYSSLSGFALFLFSMAWNGWQYIFYLIFFFTSIYILWRYYQGKKIKECLLVLTIVSGGALLLLLISTGFINFIRPFYALLDVFNLIGNPWSSWPDLYYSIAELQQPSLKVIFLRLGFILLAMGILGCLLISRLMINESMKKEYLRKTSTFFLLFLIFWIVFGLFSLFKGVRFIILLIPPLSISAGMGAGVLFTYLGRNKNLKFKPAFYILLFTMIILPQFLAAHEIIKVLEPGVNDDLWESAEWIKTNTPNGTLIISDWRNGHLLTAIAERPVIQDGRSAYIETLPVRRFYGDNLTFNGRLPNTSREYWIRRAFSTSNETLSRGIFTMLANSGDYATLTLEKYTRNTTKTVNILNDILGVDKSVAEIILSNKYHFDSKQIDEVLKYSHPTLKNTFVIYTHERMISTGRWFFYFGEWNFNESNGTNYTYSVGSFEEKGGIVNSSNDVYYNLKAKKITWNKSVPYCLVNVRGDLIEKDYLNSSSDFCVVLLWDSHRSVIIDKKFENSLFTKLVLERENTEYFESVYKNKKVVVWKTTSY